MLSRFRIVFMLAAAAMLVFAFSPAHSKRKKKKSAFRTSCSKELKRHCKKVKTGKGRLLKCVKGLKKRKVSKRCRGYLAKRKKRFEAKAGRTVKRGKPGVSRFIKRPAPKAASTTSTTAVGNSATSAASGAHASCNQASTCSATNDCCPDSSATGSRLKVIQEAKAILDSHLTRRGSTCENEKNLYYPRQCSGFVIDAFYQAGLIDVAMMKHYDWNANYTKKYAKCGGGEYVQNAASANSRTSAALSSGTWRPNVNVSYMRDTYCTNRTGESFSSEGGCAHPWFTRISESKVKPGDLWVSSNHVGIVYDAKNKVMVHNAMSTGPTMDRWDSDYYKNKQSNVIFVRHHEL